MNASITLTAAERKTLLDYYRAHPDPQLRLRAHLVLLLADGYAWATIAAVLYCSSRTSARWKDRFQQGRLDALRGRPRGAPGRFTARWITLVVGWVTTLTPRAFGFLRSRWCCDLVVLLLGRLHHLDVSRETIRRWLQQADLVWCRTWPTTSCWPSWASNPPCPTPQRPPTGRWSASAPTSPR
jgi:transposase